jgi:hypothetical protein
MSEVIDSLDDLLNHYENTNKKDSTPRISREELVKKYFSPQNNEEEFRPIKFPNGSRIEEGYFHKVKVGNKYRKIYCPEKNDGAECALCKLERDILAKQKKGRKEDLTDAELESNKKLYKLAKTVEAKKFFILKGIDKGAEKDGAKFWRFPENYKKDGVYDKYIAAVKFFKKQHSGDPYDTNEGCNFTVNSVIDSMPNGAKFRKVTAIQPGLKSKLSEDSNKASTWLADTLTWTDVFKVAKAPTLTPQEYLEFMAKQFVGKGIAPYYDEANKLWVCEGNSELQQKMNTRDNLDSSDEDTEVYDSFDEDDDAVSKLINEEKKTSQPAHNGVNLDDIDSLITAQEKAKPAQPSSADIEKKTSSEIDDLLADIPF